MFVISQKVILPKSHGEKEGVIVLIPKKVREQQGLTQIKGRVKVSYITTGGGATEAWFDMDKLEAWRKPADITKELEIKHEAEMKAVAEEHDKEKLDWIDSSDDKVKSEDVEVIPPDGEPIIEVDKNTNIKEEMKKSEDKVIKESQTILKKDDDNSDSYGG